MVLPLPSGRTVSVLSSAGLLATNFKAFEDRGQGDILGSPDFEDIAMLIGCCPSVVSDAERLPAPVQRQLSVGATSILEGERLDYAMAAVPLTVRPERFIHTLRAISELSPEQRR